MTRAVKELTTYKIGEDGRSVTPKMPDELGIEAALSFGIGELGSRIIPLPGFTETLVERQSCDGSYQLAYPVAYWAIEGSTDQSSLNVILQTKDGFAVSFSMSRGKAMKIAHALSKVEHNRLWLLTNILY